MELLIGVCNMTIDGRRLFIGSIPETALFGDWFADIGDTTKGQVAVGRVGEPRSVRGVGRVTRAQIRIVHRHYNGTILLGHRRNGIWVIGIG